MSEVDTFVGKQIRTRRMERGKSQSDLAAAIGVRFQQIQKYESGVNRVSASRLWAIADALSTPIEFFFDGLDDAIESGTMIDEDAGEARDTRTISLVRDFRRLPETQKRAVLAIVKSMAKEKNEPEHRAPLG